MKLYVTLTSPYARLARILVLEKALEDRVEIIAAKTRAVFGWQGVHTQTSNGKECDVIGIARRDSAQVLPKRRNEPIVLPSFNLRNSATY